MDESNYKRLSCCSIGCSKESLSRIGGLCLTHKKRQEHVKYMVHCTHCSKEYESLRVASMYCSNNCKQAAWGKKNPQKVIDKRQKQAPVGFREFACEGCKAKFTTRHKRKFCNKKCQLRDKDENIRLKRVVEHNSSVEPVSCRGCRLLFSPLYGRFLKAPYCSECDKTVPASAWSVRRRERIKAASIEVVSRETVFERDKWRCAMCGVKTIKTPFKKNSAELDHIVPLALGGMHSYANTQCSCRKCNGSKGAKAIGQTLLFG